MCCIATPLTLLWVEMLQNMRILEFVDTVYVICSVKRLLDIFLRAKLKIHRKAKISRAMLSLKIFGLINIQTGSTKSLS